MKKPVLYIIHGWTYTTAPWTKTIELLQKKGLKVEMLQVPGLTTPSKKVWTIEDYVKWADRSIPDGAVALGHSNGGRILLNLCSENPKKLQHLILLDAAGVYEISNKRDIARTLSKKLAFLKRIPGVTKVWHKLTGASDYAKAPDNMKQTLANMLESDRTLDLSRVTTPTSILWGAADTVTPPRQAEVMHQRIFHSTLEIYPDWTHAPYISHPAELAKVIYQTYQKPPAPIAPDLPDDAAAISAALAIKKAPEPILETKGGVSDVVPNVPTKLTLRKDEKLTDGMKVSDAEGAAVKYQPKAKGVASKATDAAAGSASANFRRAEGKKIRPTDAMEESASANLRKASGPKVPPPVVSSAKILTTKKSVSEEETSILAELDQKSSEKVDFVALEPEKPTPGSLPGAITSASVPKVSALEKVKRKAKSRKSAKSKGKNK